MALMKRSPGSKPNSKLLEKKAKAKEGNRAWLERQGDADGVILLGAASLEGFRVRVAQSSLRSDMLPSMWSLCGVLLRGGVFASVPLNLEDVSSVPKCNGIRLCALDQFDDPQLYPNIAVIRFAKAHPHIHEDIERLQSDRSIIDIPVLMLPWLGFVWGATGAANPLLQSIGVPSAAFVETVFAMSGFELTPGLSSASSCPEAIWQSAKWWSGYYKDTAQQAENSEATALPMVPAGAFLIRQKDAAVLVEAQV